MQRQQPLYRRSSAPNFGGYSLRLMLGWIASLGLLVLLLHLPVDSSSPRVGWGPRPTERIALSEISEPEDAPEAEASGDAGAPPATQQLLPSESGPAGESSGKSGDDGPDETATATDSSGTSSDVHPVASLTTSDRRPRIIGGQGILNLHIHYPAAARRQGIEGRLKLTFTVDTDGQARNVQVTEPLHPLCDSAAVDAIQAVRFQPGTYRGEPVPVRMSLPIRFKLQPRTQLSPNQTAGVNPDE